MNMIVLGRWCLAGFIMEKEPVFRVFACVGEIVEQRVERRKEAGCFSGYYSWLQEP